jgi:hypothetical protein
MTYTTGKRELNKTRHAIPRNNEEVPYIVLFRKKYVDNGKNYSLELIKTPFHSDIMYLYLESITFATVTT